MAKGACSFSACGQARLDPALRVAADRPRARHESYFRLCHHRGIHLGHVGADAHETRADSLGRGSHSDGYDGHLHSDLQRSAAAPA